MKKIALLLLTGTLFLSACQSPKQDISEESGSSLPTISIESFDAQRYAEDGETLLVEISRDSMTLSGAGYEKAANTVKNLFYCTEEELSKEADDLVEMAMEQYTAMEDQMDWFSPYGSSTTYEVTRLDADVLSVRGISYDYEGGAHGYVAEWGTTIDLKSGDELTLSQLAGDTPGFMDKVLEVVLENLNERKEQDELFDTYESYVEQNIEETNWYLDETGIVLVYTPYEIGPYSSGSIAVQIPYEAVTEYMKTEYLPPQEN